VTEASPPPRQRGDGSSRTVIGWSVSALDVVRAGPSSSSSKHVWNEVVAVTSPEQHTDRLDFSDDDSSTTSDADRERPTSGENSTSGLQLPALSSWSRRPAQVERALPDSRRPEQRRRRRRHGTTGKHRDRLSSGKNSTSGLVWKHIWNEVVAVTSPEQITDRLDLSEDDSSTTSDVDRERPTSGENSTSGLMWKHVWNEVVAVTSLEQNTDRLVASDDDSSLTSVADRDRPTSGENSTSGLRLPALSSRSRRPAQVERALAGSRRPELQRRRRRRHGTAGKDQVREICLVVSVRRAPALRPTGTGTGNAVQSSVVGRFAMLKSAESVFSPPAPNRATVRKPEHSIVHSRGAITIPEVKDIKSKVISIFKVAGHTE